MIRAINLTKTYPQTSNALHALKNVNLEIKKGLIYGIIGASGAGKSTLLRLLGGLEEPTTGEVLFNNKNINLLSRQEKRLMHQRKGIVFQKYYLLNQKNVFENIAFPMRISQYDNVTINQKVTDLLDLVGLKDKALEYPSKLSGGQQQRVAIARALATYPDVLLLDEITSALDPFTTKAVLDLIKGIYHKQELTIILITHDMEVIKYLCDYVYVLHDGEVIENGPIKAIINQPNHPITKRLLGGINHG